MVSKKNIALVIFLIVYIIVLAILYWPEPLIGDEDIVREWQNHWFNISAMFGVLMGIYAIRKYGIRSIQGMSILFLTLGVAFWLLGELTWMIFDVYLGIDPFPSVADVFYLLGYVPFIIGILKGLKIGKISWTSKKVLVSVLIAVVLSLITFYYGIYSAYDEEATLTENVVAMSYGVGDLILIIGLILLVNLSLEFSGGILSTAWIVFVIGMVATLVADILFAIYYGPYETGEWLYLQMDYLWIAGYLLFGYSFLMMGDAIDKLKDFVSLRKKKR